MPQNGIGGVFNVLSKRRGEIIEETQAQGMPLFNLKAFMPVNESFGKADTKRFLAIYLQFFLTYKPDNKM